LTTETALLAVAAVISMVLMLLFAVDLVTAWPLERYSPLTDVTYLLCGLGVAYLTWHAHRDVD
jgi:uncharacterized membrane protein YuzA (DUF378 family)